jgi:ABC-type oligopeptide transport system ATPase subunit
MSKSPPLHLGWQLDVSGVTPPGVPVNLKSSGLKSHTAIIAQSGSGKSFMLGRLLEEIASKTRARIVVLDPNSDFIKFSEIEETAWTESYLQPWFEAKDTLSKFQKRWSTVGFSILTNRDQSSLGLTNSRAEIAPVSISWGKLTTSQMASYLGFSMRAHPAEMYALHQVYNLAKSVWKKEHGDTSFSLERFWQCAAALWVKTLASEEITTLEHPEWPLDEIRLREGEISPNAALSLYANSTDLLGFEIWDRAESEQSLTSYVQRLNDRTSNKRVLTIDLASLDMPEERLATAHAILNSLWDVARGNWLEAIKRPSKEDNRFPIFIVIDEAHNLAPMDPVTVTAQAVNNILVRIATEGRKYGLALILVTQRPNRLHPGVLSQCDNLCLLKMNNRLDLDLVEHGFGFLPEGAAKRALEFKVGDVLFSGNLVERPVYSHAAPRRTVEGGRNLEDEFWLQDPLKKPA